MPPEVGEEIFADRVPDSLSTISGPIGALAKGPQNLLFALASTCSTGPSTGRNHSRGRVEKSGPLFEFNFLGRLAIILAFVLIQLLVGLQMQ